MRDGSVWRSARTVTGRAMTMAMTIDVVFGPWRGSRVRASCVEEIPSKVLKKGGDGNT
jgi:hypothetical protein